nr:MAG TPA_asm: hypothetical protein [Inoviridae sp.]
MSTKTKTFPIAPNTNLAQLEVQNTGGDHFSWKLTAHNAQTFSWTIFYILPLPKHFPTERCRNTIWIFACSSNI